MIVNVLRTWLYEWAVYVMEKKLKVKVLTVATLVVRNKNKVTVAPMVGSGGSLELAVGFILVRLEGI